MRIPRTWSIFLIIIFCIFNQVKRCIFVFCEFLNDVRFLEIRNNIFEENSLKAFLRQSFKVFDFFEPVPRYLESVTLNAKEGKGTPEEREVLGQHGTGDRNENGERICEFCEMNGLVITGTIFPRKEIHKATWTSPNGRTKNQIDHTMIAKEYRSSFMDTVVRRGADVGSDHYLSGD